MEKTEMMKRFEKETGKQSAIVKFMSGGQALEQKSYPKLGPYDYSMDYIAWLEAKANIADEAIKAFQKIIRNQCDEISALKEKAEAYDRLMSGGKKTLKELANILGKPVAIDIENRLWWFPKKPEIGLFTWIWYDGHFGCFGEELPKNLIDYTGDWKDSLTLPDGWEEAK
jgi:hypothetical protein